MKNRITTILALSLLSFVESFEQVPNVFTDNNLNTNGTAVANFKSNKNIKQDHLIEEYSNVLKDSQQIRKKSKVVYHLSVFSELRSEENDSSLNECAFIVDNDLKQTHRNKPGVNSLKVTINLNCLSNMTVYKRHLEGINSQNVNFGYKILHSLLGSNSKETLDYNKSISETRDVIEDCLTIISAGNRKEIQYEGEKNREELQRFVTKNRRYLHSSVLKSNIHKYNGIVTRDEVNNDNEESEFEVQAECLNRLILHGYKNRLNDKGVGGSTLGDRLPKYTIEKIANDNAPIITKTSTAEDNTQTSNTENNTQTSTTEDNSQTTNTENNTQTSNIESSTQTNNNQSSTQTSTTEDNSQTTNNTQTSNTENNTQTTNHESSTQTSNIESSTQTTNSESSTQTSNIESSTQTSTTEDNSQTFNIENSTQTSNIESSTQTTNTDNNTETSNIENSTQTSNTENNTQTTNTENNTETSNTEDNTQTSTTEDNTQTSNNESSTQTSNTENSTQTSTTENSTQTSNTEDTIDDMTETAFDEMIMRENNSFFPTELNVTKSHS